MQFPEAFTHFKKLSPLFGKFSMNTDLWFSLYATLANTKPGEIKNSELSEDAKLKQIADAKLIALGGLAYTASKDIVIMSPDLIKIVQPQVNNSPLTSKEKGLLKCLYLEAHKQIHTANPVLSKLSQKKFGAIVPNTYKKFSGALSYQLNEFDKLEGFPRELFSELLDATLNGLEYLRKDDQGGLNILRIN